MRIQHNISALNTYRQMGTNNTGSAKSLEKLSSGYKINRAGDDAAGLAISEKMRSQINGLNRASANAQDGISLIQAAEGALQETESILQRMDELAVQAANDTLELEDRQAIQNEVNQLKTEIDRIAYTTEFNKKTLLDGSLQQGGYATKLLSGQAVTAGAHIDSQFAADAVAQGNTVEDVYTVSVIQAGTYTTDTFFYDLTGMAAGDTLSIDITFDNDMVNGGGALPGGQTMSAVPVFTYTATGNAGLDNSAFINGLKDSLTKVVKDYEVTTSGNSITFMAKGIGGDYSNVSLNPTLSGPNQTPVGAPTEDGTGLVTQPLTATGQQAIIQIDGNKSGLTGIQLDTDAASGFYVNGVFTDTAGGAGTSTGLVFEIGDLTKEGASIVEVKGGNNLTLQVGANTGKDQTIDVAVRSLSASSLGVDNLSMLDNVSARSAVAAIQLAINTVSTQRAELGSVQNRLEHTTANLDTVSENLQDAESRIRDVDVAKEMMNFTKYNILMQASQAMMAQANSQPQGVLQLLR